MTVDYYAYRCDIGFYNIFMFLPIIVSKFNSIQLAAAKNKISWVRGGRHEDIVKVSHTAVVH